MLLGNYALYLIVCTLMWHSRFLRPLKMFIVFLHELGQAVAVWATCGKVHCIEVHSDHNGVTHWSQHEHRIWCVNRLVLPAGYVGSAFWGGAILVCCSRPATTQAMAMVLILLLAVAVAYSMRGKSDQRMVCRGGWTFPTVCAGMSLVLISMLCLCHSTAWPLWDVLLSKTLLLGGTMSTLFATYDIWLDCMYRPQESSISCRYAELLGLPMANGRCVGTALLCAGLWVAVSSVFLALRVAPKGPVVRGPGDLHLASCIFLLLPAAVLVATVADRWPALTAAVTAATGGRARVRPWASASYISPQPLRDVLLADWRGVDGKIDEHRGGSKQSHQALEAAEGTDVALQEWREGDHEEEALFFMDAEEGNPA